LRYKKGEEMDIEENEVNEKTLAWRKLENELDEGKRSGEENGWVSASDVRKNLEEKHLCLK